MKYLNAIILLLLLSFIAACSDEKAPEKKVSTGDHVWKQQTDALKTSKEVAEQMQKNLEQQQKTLNESN